MKDRCLRYVAAILIWMLTFLTGCSGEEAQEQKELADVGNEKEKIVLLYTDYDSYLQGLIVEFNKQSDKYMVELETVDDTYSYNDTVTYVNSRLVSQNSPDLILSSYTFYEMYMEDKVLEDLMPYLESSSELNVKDYRESVIEPFKKGDALYGIPYEFSISTLGGRETQVGGENGWSIETFLTYLEDNPDVQFEWDGDAFGILQFCLKYGMNRFVDYENGTCEFDGEEFKELLMRIDALERKNSSHNQNWSTVMKEGQKIIAEIYISNFEFYPQMEVEYGDKINFIGYPTTDGDLKCQLTPGSIMGILTKSKHKEGAWEFYEYYMNNYPVRWGFSSNVEIFQQDLQKAMEKKFMKNDDGEQLELPVSNTYPDNEPVYAMTKEQADKILTAIDAAEPFPEEERRLMDIVTSEAVFFFYGNKPLDEVTKLIQNRVQLYLNENT